MCCGLEIFLLILEEQQNGPCKASNLKQNKRAKPNKKSLLKALWKAFRKSLHSLVYLIILFLASLASQRWTGMESYGCGWCSTTDFLYATKTVITSAPLGTDYMCWDPEEHCLTCLLQCPTWLGFLVWLTFLWYQFQVAIPRWKLCEEEQNCGSR